MSVPCSCQSNTDFPGHAEKEKKLISNDNLACIIDRKLAVDGGILWDLYMGCSKNCIQVYLQTIFRTAGVTEAQFMSTNHI